MTKERSFPLYHDYLHHLLPVRSEHCSGLLSSVECDTMDLTDGTHALAGAIRFESDGFRCGYCPAGTLQGLV